MKHSLPEAPTEGERGTNNDKWGVDRKTVVTQTYFWNPCLGAIFDSFVNNANLGAIARIISFVYRKKCNLYNALIHGEDIKYWEKQPSDLIQSCDQPSKCGAYESTEEQRIASGTA